MEKVFFTDEFNKTLKSDGWHRITAGSTRDINYDDRCAFFVKRTKIAEIFKTSAKNKPKNHAESTKIDTPPKSPMVYWKGEGESECKPSRPSEAAADIYSDYVIDSQFLNEMQSDNDSLIIRADSFWVGNPSNLISYNLSCVKNEFVFNFVFFVFSDVVRKLSIDYLLGRVLDYLQIDRIDRRNCSLYQYIPLLSPKGNPVVKTCSKKCDAKKLGVYAFINGKASSTSVAELKKSGATNFDNVKTVYDFKSYPPISVTLLLNYGLKFLSSLETQRKYSVNLLSHSNCLCNLNHGIFTNKVFNLAVKSTVRNGWDFLYLVNLDLRDAVTLNCTGDNNAPSELYGKVAGCNQTDFCSTKFGMNYCERLDEFLKACPIMYMKYACEYNNNILMYMCRLWGFNKSIPCTITSAACKVAQAHICSDMGFDNDIDYLAGYAGCRVVKRKERSASGNKFKTDKDRQPLNDDCDVIQRLGSKSFRGGYNGCCSVDVHNGHWTYDIDIESAYPTAMALVPAIEYSDPIIARIVNRDLSLDDFLLDGLYNPMTPIFAYVTYEFPNDCPFPNLPRFREDDEEAPCYPLTETDGVYCSGPELYTALKLGAKIHVINGVRARVKRDESGQIIYPYRSIVKALVAARNEASSLYGKKSLQCRLLKLTVNSLYGKVAQNVSKMYSKSNKSSESHITNNASASLITSFVRAVLFSAFYEIHQNGYHVYSATTDGFICDMPFEDFNQLPLLGLREWLVESRHYITEKENPDIWSVKHEQDDLINLTTRGNASLIVEDKASGILGGVIARNGAGSKHPELPKDDIKNRKEFILSAVSRTGKIDATYKLYSSIDDVRGGQPYTQAERIKSLRMDFDMKRKPLEESLKAEVVNIDGKSYEVAHVETVPFNDKDEFLLYRDVYKSNSCIRTVAEWKRFFEDVRTKQTGQRISPHNDDAYQWKILCDCIAAYKAGLCDIPQLDNPDLKVADKVDWIQSFNKSDTHIFTKKTWDKCSEKKRQKSILPLDILQNTLNLLNSICEDKAHSDTVASTVCEEHADDSSVKIIPDSIDDEDDDLFYDDEAKLLEESLNSKYFDNPYTSDDFNWFDDEDELPF